MDQHGTRGERPRPTSDGQPTLWQAADDLLATDMPFVVAFLALGAARGLGNKGLRALVHEHREQLGRVWQAPTGRLAAELAHAKVPTARKVADEISASRTELLKTAQAKADDLARRDIHLIGPSALPARLAELPGGPLWLFVEGDVRALYEG
ncbi:hypothetical protein ACFWM7_34470, partial [Streptomyces sp. NPDC058375]|uniref:hypothetical protein n=1 Tax=Streptomyces sp. NPDC058375 TaxID=3346467 RepID=UPI003665948B